MENRAENVIENIGAVAEAVSVFYNSIAGRVPKDVALALTTHFMDLTITRRGALTPAQLAQAVALAEAKRRQLERQKRQAQPEQAEQKPEARQTPPETEPGENPETPPQA